MPRQGELRGTVSVRSLQTELGLRDSLRQWQLYGRQKRAEAKKLMGKIIAGYTAATFLTFPIFMNKYSTTSN